MTPREIKFRREVTQDIKIGGGDESSRSNTEDEEKDFVDKKEEGCNAVGS